MSKSKSQYIVAIDSQTLIWAVRKQGTADQLQRAKWLFELFDLEDAQVLLPTIVISEYLAGTEKKHHASVIDAINRRFLVKPFDIECASYAAQLFIAGKPMRPRNVPLGREVLRSDTLIIATAKAHRAKTFYSGDFNCRELAKTIMDARDLPLNSPLLFPPH